MHSMFISRCFRGLARASLAPRAPRRLTRGTASIHVPDRSDRPIVFEAKPISWKTTERSLATSR